MAAKSKSSLSGAMLGLFMLTLVLPVLVLWLRVPAELKPWIAAWAGSMSLATFAVYAIDKRHARSGDWREPEFSLHLLELIGGWPGALLAQQLLRHKNAKRSYQVVFWFIVLIHQLVALDWLRQWPMARAIAHMIR